MSYAPVLRSEWRKTRSVPSLGGVLALVFLATVGFSLLGAAAVGQEDATEPDFDPLLISFFGVNFGQVIAISFGALVAAAQFKNDGLRVWFVAVPRRGRLYLASLSVTAVLSLVVGLLTSVTCFVGGQLLLGDNRMGWTDPAVYRAVIGCALYLMAMSLFGFGTSMLFRSAAATLGFLIPVVLLLSFMLGNVTSDAGVADYLPDRAGRQVLVEHPIGTPGPWTGLLVTAAWALFSIIMGWAALRRRDA